jgi:hypothetical protein
VLKNDSSCLFGLDPCDDDALGVLQFLVKALLAWFFGCVRRKHIQKFLRPFILTWVAKEDSKGALLISELDL